MSKCSGAFRCGFPETYIRSLSRITASELSAGELPLFAACAHSENWFLESGVKLACRCETSVKKELTVLLTLLRSQPGATSKERLKRLMFSPYENRADKAGDEKLFLAGLVPEYTTRLLVLLPLRCRPILCAPRLLLAMRWSL